jgi:predicted aldo/keto reductase-like oxidoreductase
LSERAAEVVAPIVKRLDETLERTLGKEWLETWHLGLPEWEDTPEHINIPTILHLRNLVKAFDMVEYAKMRYNLLGNGGHWFPGRNAAKVDGVDLSGCLRGARHAERIPGLLAETHGMLGGKEVKRLQAG